MVRSYEAGVGLQAQLEPEAWVGTPRPEQGGFVLDSASGLGGSCSPLLGGVETKGADEPGLWDEEMETTRPCPRGAIFILVYWTWVSHA